MQTKLLAILSILTIGIRLACGQTPPGQPTLQPLPGQNPQPPPRMPYVAGTPQISPSTQAPLTKFNLDFPGGTPGELVRAIEKASSKSLNAIIPLELSHTRLPELRMKSVDVAQLFQALELASVKTVTYESGRMSGFYGGSQGALGGRAMYQTAQTAFGFKTQGTPSDDSVWYFFYQKPELPREPVVCRYWQLAPYLDAAYKIEDITTAIQTGWKMLGESAPPTINFHKDTKLLIAVGENDKLALIDSVLAELAKTAKVAVNLSNSAPPQRRNVESKPPFRSADKSAESSKP